MHGSLLLGVATVFVLGLGAQWIEWRLRLPSILLLLVFGFVAGPVTHLLDPAALQGDWVFTFASVSVGIILFEGGLSLRLEELREVRNAVHNLITIGVAITSVLFVGAHDWARKMAKTLRDEGFAVLMVDSNRKNIQEARRENIPAQRANVPAKFPESVIPLLLVRASSTLRVFSENPPTTEKGDRLIALVGPVENEDDLRLMKETIAGNSLPPHPGVAQGDGSPLASAS